MEKYMLILPNGDTVQVIHEGEMPVMCGDHVYLLGESPSDRTTLVVDRMMEEHTLMGDYLSPLPPQISFLRNLGRSGWSLR